MQAIAMPAFFFDLAWECHFIFLMSRVLEHLNALFRRRRLVVAVLVVLFCAGVVWTEHRTYWFARQLGAYLLLTNALRPQTGAVWQRIHARTQTQQNLDATDPMPIPLSGLPVAVARNRFECSRVPEIGEASYVAIYKTPLPDSDPNAQPLGDVIASLRAYRQGLSIVKALHLPDVHFHARVRNRFEHLYAEFGDGASDPDSLKAAVFAELATDLIPALRQRERAALIDAYQNGQVAQILLFRDLGHFRGELYRDEGHVPIAFEIDAKAVSEIVK